MYIFKQFYWFFYTKLKMCMRKIYEMKINLFIFFDISQERTFIKINYYSPYIISNWPWLKLFIHCSNFMMENIKIDALSPLMWCNWFSCVALFENSNARRFSAIIWKALLHISDDFEFFSFVYFSVSCLVRPLVECRNTTPQQLNNKN